MLPSVFAVAILCICTDVAQITWMPLSTLSCNKPEVGWRDGHTDDDNMPKKKVRKFVRLVVSVVATTLASTATILYLADHHIASCDNLDSRPLANHFTEIVHA